MGYQNYTYLGPVVQVLNQPRAVSRLTSSCSARCGSTLISDAMRFCPDCGAPVSTVKAPQVEVLAVRADDQRLEGGRWVDEFWTPESCFGKKTSLWLPNKVGYSAPQDVPTDPDMAMALDTPALEAARQRLLSTYGDLFECYERVFNTPVKVFVGLVAYYA